MIRRLLQLWPHGRTMHKLTAWYAIAGLLQGGLLVMIVPLLHALLADPPRLGEAVAWLVAAVVVGVAYLATVWWSKSIAYRTAHGIMRDLQQAVGQHLQRLPLGWFVGNPAGRLARTVAQSTPTAAGIVSHVWPELVQSVVTPATVVVGAFLVDWRMGLAFLVTVPVALFVLRKAGPVVRDTQAVMDTASAEAAGRAIEFAQAQPVFRATGRALEGHAPMERALDEQRRTYRVALIRSAVPQLVYVSVVQIGFTVVLVVGVWLALGGTLAVADAVALLVLAALFVEPLAVVANLFGIMRVADVALERVAEVLAADPLPEPASSARPGAADVELDGVEFSYGGAPVLRGLSLRLPAGAMTALVGPSGAGKTTILRLIARFWDVDRGSVRIGGVDVRQLTTPALMDQISIVFQDTYLFAGTIEENVRMAAPEASAAAVADAVAAARLDEVINRLPNGWDSQVGEGGVALSGGERQRVAIARALLKDAPIVLLDEVTAALDPENEAAVAAGMSAMAARGKTILVIAHRLSTVVRADQIAVVEEGRIVELGRHDDLLAAGGRYASFWSERSRAAGWRITSELEKCRGSSKPSNAVTI